MDLASKRVWLSFVSYPVTTAVYFERALRKMMKVTTFGPKIDDLQIKDWRLESMPQPVLDQDIPLPYEYDIESLYQQTPSDLRPDLFLWVESIYGHFPQNIDRLPCKKACYLIDSHLPLNLVWHKEWARKFDYVFVAQREYIPQFQAAGIHHIHWLPLGCDPEVHARGTGEKIYDVGFVGTNPEGHIRHTLLKKVSEKFNVHIQRCFWKEMADVFSKSRIVFNKAILNDLNMRVFESMSTGSMLLTDQPSEACGQNELFTPGEDFAVYTEENLLSQVDYYLKNDAIREKIAASGYEKVKRAHTYQHRVEAMLEVVFNQTITTPDANQWRDRSLGISERYFEGEVPWRGAILASRPKRSFVIPVLDKSPASPYNIETLLKDLEAVEGDVIVVFNSEKMAEAYARHPRVTRSATLSQNVGVARAWNIGVHMAESPIIFIANADLQLRPKSVTLIERTLERVDRAAVAGPQGSFFNFFGGLDYQYFDKGACVRPLQVDAISGFYFAVKRAPFVEGELRFEDDYTPCYYEEWDLGLQCREKGWECWVAPTTDFDHEWSGTIRAHRVVKFFDHQESIFDIHARNTKRFHQKWRARAERFQNPELLLSRYPQYLKQLADEARATNNHELAQGLQQKADFIVEHFNRALKF